MSTWIRRKGEFENGIRNIKAIILSFALRGDKSKEYSKANDQKERSFITLLS